MSNAINDDVEEGEDDLNKNPLIDEEIPDKSSKSHVIAYYGLTVGVMLLLVVIVLIIAVKFGSAGKKEKSNSFTSLYISDENTTIKLFNLNINKSISSLIIDGQEVNKTNEYIFESKGKHKVEVYLNEELGSLSSLFENCSDLIEVVLSQIKTDKLTNMSKMFNGCAKLTSVDLSKLGTSNVLDMSNLFNGCIELESINLNKTSTAKVERMNNMFSSCSKLKSLNLTNFKTSKVKNMSAMFMVVVPYLN